MPALLARFAPAVWDQVGQDFLVATGIKGAFAAHVPGADGHVGEAGGLSGISGGDGGWGAAVFLGGCKAGLGAGEEELALWGGVRHPEGERES